MKSDLITERTLKLVISRFCLYEVAKKGTNFIAHVLHNCFAH